MTRPQRELRVRDLPAGQAEVLSRIHELATEAEHLRRKVQDSYLGAASEDNAFMRLSEVDRDLKLTEARAYGSGIPPSWVAHAHQLGRNGHEWTLEQRLPAAGTPPRRSPVGRVINDTRQMTEMAAVLAVREHLLAAMPGALAPNPAAAQQFSRNLEALRTRAARTADSVAISASDRDKFFIVSDEEFVDRVRDFLDYSPGDLDMVWRRHSVESIASGVRRSLKNLRRADSGKAVVPPGPSARQPPDPASLIQRARQVLRALVSEQSDTGAEIDAAIADATLADGVDPADTTPDADPGSSAITAAPEHGHDP
ncbi:hypothetical protein ACFYO1_02915 [Nocardia sp. NPDC006044]|uniref:hypothetical protein n=1 Tax=Nocardia sp. NPDC006044 TaxID=3364306 RepID=UPI00368DE200